MTAAFEDVFGNVATGFSGAVNLSLASSPPGGALAGTLTANASAGLASFSNLAIDLAGAGYTLQVTSGSLSASSAAIVVRAVQATRLVVVAQPPADIVAGTRFGVSVYAEDNFGNLAASFGGTVNVALVETGSANCSAVRSGSRPARASPRSRTWPSRPQARAIRFRSRLRG